MTLTSLILAGCGSASGEDEFKVECSFDQPYTGMVYLRHFEDNQSQLDSFVVDNQLAACFSQKLDNNDCYLLFTKPFTGNCQFLGQGGASYQISFNSGSNTAELVGHTSSEQLLLEEAEELLRPFDEESERLNMEYGNALPDNDNDKLKTLNDLMFKNFLDKQEVVVEFIKAHPDCFVSVYLTGNLFFNRYPSFVEVNELLDVEKYAGTAAYCSFKDKMEKCKSIWMEGQPAPDFSTKDKEGNVISLSDFKGKYVLLDFWASWCRPCRLKAKELKKIYPELKEKGIVVLGVSLDEHREDWLKATLQDEIIWYNTCECVSFVDHPIASLYKVKQIPSLFLVGPDGKIVRQDPDIGYIQSLFAE